MKTLGASTAERQLLSLQQNHTAMRIKKILLHHVKIPFSESIDHNLKKRATSESIVVSVQTKEGVVGYGEGAPRQYVTGETTAQVLQKAPTILKQCLHLKIQSMEEIAHLSKRISHCYKVPALATALELALLDILAQEKGVSIDNLFQNNNTFTTPYSAVLPFLPLDKTKKWLQFIAANEFKHLKIKVGTAQDEALLDLVRTELGDDTDIRLDANRAWDFKTAVEKINQLAKYNISCIEEPLKATAISRLAELSKVIPTPILVDESLCSIEDAEYFISAIPAQRVWFNLKLSKLGGFIATSKLHQKASNHHIKCQLGCNVGETAILSAAGRLFAQTHALSYLEGSFAPFFMEDDIGTTPIYFGRGGAAPPLMNNGIGITIDPKKLAQHSAYSEVLCMN